MFCNQTRIYFYIIMFESSVYQNNSYQTPILQLIAHDIERF